MDLVESVDKFTRWWGDIATHVVTANNLVSAGHGLSAMQVNKVLEKVRERCESYKTSVSAPRLSKIQLIERMLYQIRTLRDYYPLSLSPAASPSQSW